LPTVAKFDKLTCLLAYTTAPCRLPVSYIGNKAREHSPAMLLLTAEKFMVPSPSSKRALLPSKGYKII
jgi:hypothetical protein